ncbi:MAG: ribonuclease III [SAR324 cluster bacterium]|nr:ribonuclease III [SAR324 cluster bacterium]
MSTIQNSVVHNTPDNNDLEQLQQKLGYWFQNINYLIQALTHKSYAHENKQENNERLEFLGDAILQFVISDYLMIHYSDLPEGMLSKFRAVLVSENGLSTLAKKIDLGRFILIGKGEETTGGREKNSILSDTIEAVFCAIFLDSREQGGIEKVTNILQILFSEEIKTAEKTFSTIDCKTDFQEFVQKRKLGSLNYKVIEESGPDHNKVFVTALMIANEIFGIGKGKSKKISEQNAAINAFQKMKDQYDN